MKWYIAPSRAVAGLIIICSIASCGSHQTSHSDLEPLSPSMTAQDMEMARAQWTGLELVPGSAAAWGQLELSIWYLEMIRPEGPTYSDAIEVLKNLQSIPISNLSTGEVEQANHDSNYLDSFFGSDPDGDGGCRVAGPGVKAAASEWFTEPRSLNLGVQVSALKEAVNDMKRGMTLDSGDKTCYQAVIDDLSALAVGSSTQAGNIGGSELSYENIEVSYLNDFFDTNAMPSNGQNVLTGSA